MYSIVMRPEPIPPRVDLWSGRGRVLDLAESKGKGGKVSDGAANVHDPLLDSGKELKLLTLRKLVNEVVIRLMAATLAQNV